MELAGATDFSEKTVTAYAPNTTPDKATGIGHWTDAQIIASIREGRRSDGSIIGPPMPIGRYRGLSDREVQTIAACLRSLPAVDHKVPRSVCAMPLPPSQGPPAGAKGAPDIERQRRAGSLAFARVACLRSLPRKQRHGQIFKRARAAAFAAPPASS
jgi:hypothetical protein